MGIALNKRRCGKNIYLVIFLATNFLKMQSTKVRVFLLVSVQCILYFAV